MMELNDISRILFKINTFVKSDYLDQAISKLSFNDHLSRRSYYKFSPVGLLCKVNTNIIEVKDIYEEYGMHIMRYDNGVWREETSDSYIITPKHLILFSNYTRYKRNEYINKLSLKIISSINTYLKLKYTDIKEQDSISKYLDKTINELKYKINGK